MILESVKVAGDDYATRPSLLMNGLGTIAAACLNSPFPPRSTQATRAHKANGARSGYSILNGLVTLLLCTTGILPAVLRFVPLEVAAPVIIWFGLITVGQAVTEVPANQAIAVIIGLIPALAQGNQPGSTRPHARQAAVCWRSRHAWAATWRWGD